MDIQVHDDKVELSLPTNPKLEAVVLQGIELKVKKESTYAAFVNLSLCLLIAFFVRNSQDIDPTAAVLFGCLGGAFGQALALTKARGEFRQARENIRNQGSSASSDDDSDEDDEDDCEDDR